jgi:biotin carboxyl carrier protein
VGDDLWVRAPAPYTLLAPFDAVVVGLPLARHAQVHAGTAVVVLEAMKMEHEVLADIDAVVCEIAVAVGDTVSEGQLLATLAVARSAVRRPMRPPMPTSGPTGTRA